MLAALFLMFGAFALSSAFISEEENPDSDDNMPDSEDEGSSGKEVYTVKLGLNDTTYNLSNFDANEDQLVIETLSLDIDFKMVPTGDQARLDIGYGNSTTSILGPWEEEGPAQEIVVRHVIGDGDDRSFEDYILNIGDPDKLDHSGEPVFLDLSGSSPPVTIVGTTGVVNFGDQDDEVVVMGLPHASSPSLDISESVPQFSDDPDLTLRMGEGDDKVEIDGGLVLVDTGAGNDTAVVTEGNAHIIAGDGDDYIDAGGSVTTGGNVIVLGGSGQDSVIGSVGSDYVDAGRDSDTIDGGDGQDTILGGTGSDTLRGGDGNDVISGSRGNVVHPETSGVSWIDYSDGTHDSLDGGAGDDQIYMDQNDRAVSGSGDDLLVVHFDPQSSSYAKIDDYNSTTDELIVVVKMNETLIGEWNATYSGNGEMEIETSAEFVKTEPSSDVYSLVIGGFKVAELTSTTAPEISDVVIHGFFEP